MIQVVVATVAGRRVGLVVDRILDVVEGELAAPQAGGRPGAAGRVVLAGRVTELLDLQALVAGLGSAAGGHHPAPAGAGR
jgi:two-component system, chemotaxis family, sensor kinase CheA